MSVDIKAIEDKYIKDMKEHCFSGDWEIDHGDADDIVIECLKELGMGELARVYDEVGKWYA